MQVFTTKSRIVITCHKWLSPALQAEVIALGYEIEAAGQTSVTLIGTAQDCIRLNLNLRCASQVMYSLKSFSCDSPDELYNALLPIPWDKLLAPDGYFSVTSNVSHSSITNGMFANLKVKDAIVDHMRDKTNQRPSTGAELKGVVINLFWKYGEAEVFIDTSGETLTKHGYRKLPGKAPMLEALAAATILSTKWDKSGLFVNPMCGSGTLAIEAALIATNRTPGLLRNQYAFMHLIGYQPDMYTTEREKLDKIVKKVSGLKIIASDISSAAISVAKTNAEAAGVANLIDFATCDFERTTIPTATNGVVMLNPEYGERLGVEAELELTYARIGDFFKNKCAGYTGYIFTGNLELAKKIRLKTSRRIEFFNATIDCRLLEYALYDGTKRVEKLVNE
ncbi:class I SAM-dependent RNA methyltransferase [Parasediminibacterium sp. JCM 36343]|uniref:THUMP domain-containing class I SAM-dependent RNA methyltransferase n=1 Tax=Parasediminibacterium sp. JCM 36343 TaxID=3374279 RepID=UPI00397B4196